MTEIGDPALAEIIKLLQAAQDDLRQVLAKSPRNERKELLERIDQMFGHYPRGNGYWIVDVDPRFPHDLEMRLHELLDLLSDCREELRDD